MFILTFHNAQCGTWPAGRLLVFSSCTCPLSQQFASAINAELRLTANCQNIY